MVEEHVTLTARALTTSTAALLSVVATYASMRAYDVLFRTEPNPATIISSANIAMFWRLGVGCYVAGAVAIAVYFATGSRHRLASKVVVAAIPVVAAMLLLQGLFLP